MTFEAALVVIALVLVLTAFSFFVGVNYGFAVAEKKQREADEKMFRKLTMGEKNYYDPAYNKRINP